MSSDDVKKTTKAVATGGASLYADPSLDPTHAAEQVTGPNAMDDTPNARRKRAHDAADAQAKAINTQNQTDAANQAAADAKTNAARLELLSRQGFGSTVLSGPGLLGRQATLG